MATLTIDSCVSQGDLESNTMSRLRFLRYIILLLSVARKFTQRRMSYHFPIHTPTYEWRRNYDLYHMGGYLTEMRQLVNLTII